MLNQAEDKMYFVSDKPGGFGDSDIYEVVIFADGSLGPPKNLGEQINTSQKECFPFITKNNQLYFSSRGYGGYGNLDVFYKDLRDLNSAVVNLGTTINSKYDDFAFSLDLEDSTGFISSNREGNSNIYSIQEVRPIQNIITSRTLQFQILFS